jgi:hypothetical protein
MRIPGRGRAQVLSRQAREEGEVGSQRRREPRKRMAQRNSPGCDGREGPFGSAGLEQRADPVLGEAAHPEANPLHKFDERYIASLGPFEPGSRCHAASGPASGRLNATGSAPQDDTSRPLGRTRGTRRTQRGTGRRSRRWDGRPSGVPGGAAFAAWIAGSEQTGQCDLAAFVEPFLRLGEDAAKPATARRPCDSGGRPSRSAPDSGAPIDQRLLDHPCDAAETRAPRARSVGWTRSLAAPRGDNDLTSSRSSAGRSLPA